MDELLPYYNRELSYIRRLADGFAADQPDAAARLRIRAGEIQDPHVERLIEAFAYLTARIRRKLDDEFPELTSALLDVLYPHYLTPVPSMAIIQFHLDESQGELSTGYPIRRGEAVEVSYRKLSCRYRTCYDTTVWPLELTSAALQGRPFDAPQSERSTDALSVIQLQLRCMSSKTTFGDFDSEALQSLRFFLAGEDHHTMPLYELLLNHTIAIGITDSHSDAPWWLLEPDRVRAVGFVPKEALIPYSARSFPGYRLFTEYFAFPHKFLFFDLCGIGRYPRLANATTLNIYFYLDRVVPDLEPHVSIETFRLGCTPIVNLFEKRAEPIKLTHKTTEYPVIPDARKPETAEVYSVDRVTLSSAGGEREEFAPLYGFATTESGRAASDAFWQIHRRQSHDEQGRLRRGTDLFLSLVDRGLEPAVPADKTLILETTCCSRDLPGDLKRPEIRLPNGGPFRQIGCLKGPTGTVRPQHPQRGIWSLISHLTLNQLSLGDVYDEQGQAVGDGADALRRMLELYDYRGSKDIQKKIRGIVGLRSRSVVDRLSSAASGFSRGIAVTVEFDEDQFRDPGQGLFLFASVLEAFFGMYCSVNSFTKLTATLGKDERVIGQWPPNAGERYLF